MIIYTKCGDSMWGLVGPPVLSIEMIQPRNELLNVWKRRNGEKESFTKKNQTETRKYGIELADT